MPTALITGANIGLGFEAARGLLAAGYEVVITSRDKNRGALATTKLRTEFPKGQVNCLDLDLSKAESVDAFASSFSSSFGNWDVLINNAGAKVLADYSETDSGIEYHYGVNAVGHFAITADLLPFRSEQARVVSVSSIVARFAPEKIGPIGSAQSYSPGASYAASKLANLLFAIELDRKLGRENFKSVAAHPGFARAEPYGPKSTRFFESFLAQSAESGARPITQAALNQDLPGESYLAPAVMELWGTPRTAKMPSSVNETNLKSNWEILEELSGRKLAG